VVEHDPCVDIGEQDNLPTNRVTLRAGAFNPPHEAPEFSLRGSDGSEVSLARYRGKVVLLSFGFTYCAAVCPTTLATLAQARSRLGSAADSVQVIFVTVDPERDNAAHMRDYLAAFDPGFIGATGDPDALAAVRQKYGVTAVRHGTGPDYAMAHNNLAVAYEANGDYDNALKEYRESLRLDRSNQYVQKNYSRFVEFRQRNNKRQKGAATAANPAAPATTTAPAGTASQASSQPVAAATTTTANPAPAPATPPEATSTAAPVPAPAPTPAPVPATSTAPPPVQPPAQPPTPPPTPPPASNPPHGGSR